MSAEPLIGRVELWHQWTPIPGTFFELRGLDTRRDLTELDYEVSYGFSPAQNPMGGHDLILSSYGRVILNVSVGPEDRSRGGIVADIWHLNIGVITVRFGLDTPLPPPKPVYTKPAGSPLFAEMLLPADQRPAPNDDPFDWNSLTGEYAEEEVPSWLKALQAEGFDVEDIRAVLDEEDGYTPKSARRGPVDLSDEDLDDEREMTPEELQRYLASKAERGE